MYRCKNTYETSTAKNGDRVWRSVNYADGLGPFIDDQIVIEGAVEGAQDDLSCSAGVVIDSTNVWHMYYLTASRNTVCSNVQVWHATSQTPGVVWQKQGQVAGIPPNNDCSIGPPSPVLVNGQIVLYYSEYQILKRALVKSGDGQPYGHSFFPPERVGSISNVCSARVSYRAPNYWLVYGREPGCDQQNTSLGISAALSDAFTEGTAILSTTANTFFAQSDNAGHFVPGDPAAGEKPRIYFSGRPGGEENGTPLPPPCTTECQNFPRAIGVLTWQGEPSVETAYPFTSAYSNEELPGWWASNAIDGSPVTDYSSFYHPTDANTTGVYLAAWRPLPNGSNKPSMVNTIRIKSRIWGLGFPKAFSLYLTNPENSDWVPIRSYSGINNTGEEFTIQLDGPRVTWGVWLYPTVLGEDNYGGHYFQIPEVSMSFRR